MLKHSVAILFLLLVPLAGCDISSTDWPQKIASDLVGCRIPVDRTEWLVEPNETVDICIIDMGGTNPTFVVVDVQISAPTEKFSGRCLLAYRRVGGQYYLEEELLFLIDDKATPRQCFEKRKDMQDKAELRLLFEKQKEPTLAPSS